MVYYRRNLLILSLTSFISTCSMYQVVPFLPMFIVELGVTCGVTFWSGMTLAAQTIAAIVMLPYWGKLADKYGRKLMIIRAGVCLTLIYLGMSYCQNLWQLLFLRVLNGALTGFAPASYTLVGTNTPQPEAARSVAIVQSAAAFGTIAGPSVGSIMSDFVGYRSSMMFAGIMVAVAVILVYLLVEERQKVSDCKQPTSLWQDFLLALKNPVLVIVLCSDMTYGFMAMASQPLLILYIHELIGFRVNMFTGLIFALPGLAIVLTNYCWCRLGERYTFQRIILVGLAGAGIFTVLQGLVRNIWWFAVAYFLVGLCSAAVSPNTAGLVATMVEADFQGRAFSIQQSSRCVGFFFGPLITGFLGGILSLQWVFVVVGLLGLAVTIAIRLQLCTYQHNEVKVPIQVDPH
jgi:DHA1 family multidrug resistance protein-like MFS transporter